MKTAKFDFSAPFWAQIKDDSKTINYDGKPMPIAYYNLVVSIRDVKLYCAGIKIHRFWKIGDVKAYFGVKGSAEAIAEQLEYIKYELTNND